MGLTWSCFHFENVYSRSWIDFQPCFLAKYVDENIYFIDYFTSINFVYS